MREAAGCTDCTAPDEAASCKEGQYPHYLSRRRPEETSAIIADLVLLCAQPEQDGSENQRTTSGQHLETNDSAGCLPKA